jgi:PAS domain S-box-containing protein
MTTSVAWRRRGPAGLSAIPFLLVGSILCTCAAAAAEALDDWRSEAGRIRTLAENDAPRAYEAAKRLQADLPSDATPADRARALNLLSRIETYLALTEPAAAHAREAFDLAASNGDRVGQAEADLNVALNAINQGKLDDLVTATQHSVTVLAGVDRPDLLGEAMLRTTVMYRRFDQFNESVAVAVQAMEIARRSNDPLALAYAHQGLAVAFEQSYRSAEALEHSQQMLVQARAAHSRLLEAFAVAGLAGQAASAGDLRRAEQLSRDATAMYREVGAPFAISFGLYGLAGVLEKTGRHREALQCLDEAIDIYKRHPNRIGQWFAFNARSASDQSLGDMAGAQADAERGYAAAKDLGVALYLSGSATRLASIASARGDYRRAYALSVEATEMTAKAAREKAGERMVQLIRRYESEGKQREIDELTRRAEQQTAQLRQRELQQRWLWTVLASVVVALAGAAFFVFRLRQSQRQLRALNTQLQRSENDVRVLNAGLEQRVQSRTLELRQQARYLRTLIDMLPMWAWFKDTQNRYLVVNQALAKARGHAPEAMVGRSDLQLLPPALARQQRLDEEEVMASRQRKTTQECVADEGGGTWMETYKAAVIDEDGTMLGTVGVARNISEQKAAEEAREAALSEATQLALQRSAFLAQISHELRTPLNAIMGFAQILQRDRPAGERAARGLNVIGQAAQHLLTLINDLLDLARIDAAKLELHPTEVDLPTFLQVIVDIIRLKAEIKGLAFVYQAAPDLPRTVRADEKRLREVLLNLLSNAAKFSDTGQVTLRVARLAPLATAAAADACARLRFEVQDQGIGMSKAQLAQLFQPFAQVADVARREGGTGLGLAISRQLVRLMGGDIRVRSSPGEGSVFWFEIEVPASQVPAQVPSEKRAPTGYQGERRRILVVDDAQQNRAMLFDSLASLGFDVEAAADGAQALDMAARFHPDLVVMDLMMPVMDGFEATRQLRRLPQNADLPIIATSASTTAEMDARCREIGVNLFLVKPIDEEALLSAIAALLHISWIRDEAVASSKEAAGHDDSDVVPPPPEEMSVLRGLARLGDMRSICERADHVERLDPRYVGFAARLRALAEGYQSKAVAAMIERYVLDPKGRVFPLPLALLHRESAGIFDATHPEPTQPRQN